MKRGLFLSIGMPRAGSAWHYNLIHDLVKAGGGQDAREIRRRYHLKALLTEVNCNIGTLSPARLLPVWIPSLFGNNYAIKTHAGPSRMALAFIRRGWITPTCIFRDPRAALLSAYEYGQRALTKGRSNAFSHLTTLEKAAEFIELYVRIWQEWMSCEDVLAVRYENLVNHYDEEVDRLIGFLGLNGSDHAIQSVLERYRPERGGTGQRGTHFSQGQVERFRKVFTAEQMAIFNEAFIMSLEKMGYSL